MNLQNKAISVENKLMDSPGASERKDKLKIGTDLYMILYIK